MPYVWPIKEYEWAVIAPDPIWKSRHSSFSDETCQNLAKLPPRGEPTTFLSTDPVILDLARFSSYNGADGHVAGIIMRPDPNVSNDTPHIKDG